MNEFEAWISLKISEDSMILDKAEENYNTEESGLSENAESIKIDFSKPLLSPKSHFTVDKWMS